MAVEFDPVLGELRTKDTSSGGQSPYSYIVAPTGGDYTTLSAALAAAAAGSTIYVKPGTYTESGGSYSTANLKIIGAGMESVSMTLSGTLTLSGNYLKMSGLTINTGTAYQVVLTGTYPEIFSNHIKGANTTFAFFNATGSYGKFHDNFIEVTATSVQIKFAGGHCNIYGNRFIANHLGSGGIYVNQYNSFNGNDVQYYAIDSGASAYLLALQDYSVANGNVFLGGDACCVLMSNNAVFSNNFMDQMGGPSVVQALNSCVVSGNSMMLGYSGVGIYATSSSPNPPALVVGNQIYDNTASHQITGIQVASTNQVVVTGNVVYNPNIGINIGTGCTNTVVTSNSLFGATTPISDSGTTTINANNAT